MATQSHSADSTEWTQTQAEALRAALAAHAGERGPLGYCELAGFLFSVACSPDPVMPSEWIPVVLGEDQGDFASVEEAQRVMELMMVLYNHINHGVLERKPALPPGIEVRANPMDNFGPQAPLGQWAGGFGAGQLWLEETWDACLPDEPEARDEELDLAMGGANAALAFFTHRELAERWLTKMPGTPTLEEAARRAVDMLPVAMSALAELGRGLQEARRASTPARSDKIGRNEPCPCGSGQKYKDCCLR